jgi:hypothetical protein
MSEGPAGSRRRGPRSRGPRRVDARGGDGGGLGGAPAALLARGGEPRMVTVFFFPYRFFLG